MLALPVEGPVHGCESLAKGKDLPGDEQVGILGAHRMPEDAFGRDGDLRQRTLALGSRDSGHAAILPVHFLEREGLVEGRDYRTRRFDSDVGKHGDTGRSEVEVVRAVLDGRADAGAIGSPFWKTVREERLVPEGALTEIWSSPPYNHCMFTARPDFEPELERRFAEALSRMSYDNPSHRVVLDAEGLRQWVAPQLDGYASLREASARQGFLEQTPEVPGKA